MRQHSIVLIMLLVACIFSAGASAQSTHLPGKVTEDNGTPVAGASVRFSGRRTGTTTKEDGSFNIITTGKGTLIISAIGYQEQQLDIAGLEFVTIKLAKTNKQLDEVVVTAYGIRRAKNTLPYAAQQISGDEANKTRVTNIAAGLSGKVSGLQIIQNNAIGGSVNVVIRGSKSLTGNNQALFVVDGVPMDNTITTSGGPTTGGAAGTGAVAGTGGYDYGNAASDINPDDIATINVLKGAAASALYGSRAANGVIMITTKKGREGMNITVNAGITVGKIDPSTFVKYQKEYGAGRSDYYATNPVNTGFRWVDVTGDGNPESVVNMVAPRSWGPKFDPSQLVYQWDAFDPAGPNYMRATPWVAGANPETFYKTAITNNTAIYMDGASSKGSYKIGFARNNDFGAVPNSNVSRNTINFGATYKLADKLVVSANANYVQDKGIGRYATGYDGNRNPNVVLRQYGETNVNFKEQKTAYFRNRKNITWNWSDPAATPLGSGLFAGFYNNIYWNVYQNYENDSRNRTYGNIALNYEAAPWLNLMARISLDSYGQFQEERSAVTSAGTPFYSRQDNNYSELNYDLLATVNKQLSEAFKFNGLVGVNMRRNNFRSIYQTTSGGLVVPNLYSIANGKSTIPPVETYQPRAVDGYFAGATLTYRDFLTLDASYRRDRSSTLPVTNNAYNYYAVSGSWVFFEHLKNVPWLTSGKLRANYATVGNDAPWGSISDVYDQPASFGSSILFSLPNTKNNNTLKPERTNSKELGLEMSFLKSRIGFDLTYYHTNTINQILPSSVSSSTGYSQKYVNAGNVQNQGFELSVFGSPISTHDFTWDIKVNFTRNRNKVLYLNDGSTNRVIGSFQGGVTLNAPVGQPYGILESQSYLMLNGKPVVDTSGLKYLLSPTSTVVIGNINPDWIGGITNSFRYRNITFSFLIDIRKGGNIFSLDQYYGQMSGILPNSAGLNDLGHPKRDPETAGGGIILPGVTPDGKTNIRRRTITSPYSTLLPPSAFAYDASYIKLRELSLSYHLPDKILGPVQKVIKGVDIQVLGRNLWLIHKNLPMSDPEENLAAGNLQGYQSGAYPTVRTLGLNVKLKF